MRLSVKVRKKIFAKLHKLKERIKQPTQRGKKRLKDDLEKKIKSLITSYVPENLVCWKLEHLQEDAFDLDFWVDKKEFDSIKDHKESFSLGFEATIPLDGLKDRGPWIYMSFVLSPGYGGQQEGKGKGWIHGDTACFARKTFCYSTGNFYRESPAEG